MSPPGDGGFRPERASAFFAAARRRGELLPGGSQGLQKGVQDTPKDGVSAVAH